MAWAIPSSTRKMVDFIKKIKGGLKKCPLHKFGARYQHVSDAFFQCEKCKAFHSIEDDILKQVEDIRNVQITKWSKGITYLFN